MKNKSGKETSLPPHLQRNFSMYRPKRNSREEQNTSLGCEPSVSKQAGQTVTCPPVGGLAVYFFGLASSWVHLVNYT